jgi:hypothetical protein
MPLNNLLEPISCFYGKFTEIFIAKSFLIFCGGGVNNITDKLITGVVVSGAKLSSASLLQVMNYRWCHRYR